MDLTKEYPRSVRDKWQGVVQLARAVDKGRAFAAGTNGEYNYDCPMDKALFEFLDMDGAALLEKIKVSPTDEQVEDYTREFVAAKSPEEIDSWNEQFLQYGPSTDEAKEYFVNLRDSIDPSRTDITTWADVLDLDEKRNVPKRTAAAV